MGPNHGSAPTKDPGCLPPLSSGDPCGTAHTTEGIGMNDWKAGCDESRTSSLVGGQWKRAIAAPRQWPTQLQERASEINRLQKVLESANLKLAAVATDILGKSGRDMLDALVDGQEDPEVL